MLWLWEEPVYVFDSTSCAAGWKENPNKWQCLYLNKWLTLQAVQHNVHILHVRVVYYRVNEPHHPREPHYGRQLQTKYCQGGIMDRYPSGNLNM